MVWVLLELYESVYCSVEEVVCVHLHARTKQEDVLLKRVTRGFQVAFPRPTKPAQTIIVSQEAA